MALDIHRGECQTEEPVESLEVATRQLVLMEKYLARFLALGASHPRRFEQLDFAHLVNDLLSLVQPAARPPTTLVHRGAETREPAPGRTQDPQHGSYLTRPVPR